MWRAKGSQQWLHKIERLRRKPSIVSVSLDTSLSFSILRMVGVCIMMHPLLLERLDWVMNEPSVFLSKAAMSIVLWFVFRSLLTVALNRPIFMSTGSSFHTGSLPVAPTCKEMGVTPGSLFIWLRIICLPWFEMWMRCGFGWSWLPSCLITTHCDCGLSNMVTLALHFLCINGSLWSLHMVSVPLSDSHLRLLPFGTCGLEVNLQFGCGQ